MSAVTLVSLDIVRAAAYLASPSTSPARTSA